MGKLKTNLVNETNKTLELFEETSSRPQIRRCRLTPKGDPNPNITLETSTSNPPHTNIVGESNYLVECEPNQTYWGLRVWCNNKAVLYVTGDELIDNSVITILCDTQNHEFTKHCEQRYNIILEFAEKERCVFEPHMEKLRFHPRTFGTSFCVLNITFSR